jgi:uncharacterized protein
VLQGRPDVGTPLGAERSLAHFSTFVLKLHARCNLRCDYCYMFAMADQNWRSRPPAMARDIIDRSAFRIAEHVTVHGVREVNIVLHGGEPLLAGPEAIAYAVQTIRVALGADIRTHFSVQTNGLLLDERFLDLFDRLDVHVGLSLDGDATSHDRHRRYANGNGSYAATAAAATLLVGRRRLFNGFLSVIDLRSDPIQAYESMLRFSPPIIDFLLPHGNWSAPPPGRSADDRSAPYGDWLATLFDHWYRTAPKETSVRVLDEIINLLLGGSSTVEGIGLSPVAVAVIESDGDIERSDALKSAYQEAGATGLNVASDPLDWALPRPGAAAGAPEPTALAAKCQECPVGTVCGGGLRAHRYQAGNEFDNPSVYCLDLYRLITHIRGSIAADLRRIKSSG